jgi:hypothetical protein
MSREQKRSVRGSQSAFMEDGLVSCKYDTGCFRAQLIGSYGIKKILPELIMRIGAINEARYEEELKHQGIAYEREVVLEQPIFHTVVSRGRMDFYCPEQEYKIHELKSATSNKTFTDVIKRGHFKPENLAQLLSYMVNKEEYKGILHYTYYEKKGEDYEAAAIRAFYVTIDDDGSILVDEEKSKFTVADYLKHRYNSGMWLMDPDMPPKPKNHADKWRSPCKYCVFKQACNMWDMGLIREREEFLNEAERGAMK